MSGTYSEGEVRGMCGVEMRGGREITRTTLDMLGSRDECYCV